MGVKLKMFWMKLMQVCSMVRRQKENKAQQPFYIAEPGCSGVLDLLNEPNHYLQTPANIQGRRSKKTNKDNPRAVTSPT